MMRSIVRLSVGTGLAVVLIAGACGGKNGARGGAPTAPSPTAVSLAILFPAGGTTFIGSTVQFQAQETLSDGTTRIATVPWESDNPTVATVSASGLVMARAAGEATIAAGANPRGARRVRVFPNFGGSWAGSEVLRSCQDSGLFDGLCDDADFALGILGAHRSTFTQAEESVTGALDAGDGTKGTATGTITTDGELELSPASYLPADPDVNSQAQNWRSRADVPSRMTGTYEILFTVPGFPGSAVLGIELQDVVNTTGVSSRSAAGARDAATGDSFVHRVQSRLPPARGWRRRTGPAGPD